jgi:hypothetical protein
MCHAQSVDNLCSAGEEVTFGRPQMYLSRSPRERRRNDAPYDDLIEARRPMPGIKSAFAERSVNAESMPPQIVKALASKDSGSPPKVDAATLSALIAAR